MIRVSCMDGWVEDFVAENDDVNSISVVAKDDADLLTSLMAGVGLPDMFCAAGRDSVSFQKAIDLLDLTRCMRRIRNGATAFTARQGMP